jgi:hypothetical protein
MTAYEKAQNECKIAVTKLYDLMVKDAGQHLTHHPIKAYLDDHTVRLNEAGDVITFEVGPHTFIIEPEYILFQGQHNAVNLYLNTYEYITKITRLITPGQPRLFRLAEITIALANSTYELPNHFNQTNENATWHIKYFDRIVEYIKNEAGAPHYDIIEEENMQTLSDEVHSKIQAGWQPFGGLATVYAKLNKDDVPDDNGEARLFYAQAIIK